jgi:spore maturation protein CgeB
MTGLSRLLVSEMRIVRSMEGYNKSDKNNVFQPRINNIHKINNTAIY